MRILIYGAGAMGCAFGGFLSKTEHEIILYGRADHLNPVRKSGLKVKGIWGRHTFQNLKICTQFDELKRFGPVDLVLLTVKSYDTRQAARELVKIISNKTTVLSVQNGLGNIEILHEYFPKSQVIAARAIFGVERSSGRIKITVWGGDVFVGETKVKKISERVKKIAGIFTQVGIKSRPVGDIRQHIWGKVIYNSALNPLASLLSVHYGALLEKDHTKWIMRQIVEECYQVAKKRKINLTPGTSKEYERLLFRKLIPDTYKHHPSMLYDLIHGKKTEIDFLNGAISRLAKQVRLATPINDLVTDLIKAREKVNI